MLSHLFQHLLADEEERNLALCHYSPDWRAGLDRRVQSLRPAGGMGFVLILLGRLSRHLSSIAGPRLLRTGAVMAMGSRAFCGTVRLVAAESGTGESSAARDFCVRGNFGAGDRSCEDRGVLR